MTPEEQDAQVKRFAAEISACQTQDQIEATIHKILSHGYAEAVLEVAEQDAGSQSRA